MESDPGFSVYEAGLIGVEIRGEQLRPHHTICGLLRRPGQPYDLVVTNIRLNNNAFVRSRVFAFADERILFRTGQWWNWGFVPKRWPYGLPLEPVPAPPPM